MLGAAPRDPRLHASAPQLPAVVVVVIAAIGEQPVRSLARATAFPSARADPIDEGQQLRDVVAMATGQRCGQRHAVTVDDQVVLGTSAGAVDRRTAGRRTTTKGADVAAVHCRGRPVKPPDPPATAALLAALAEAATSAVTSSGQNLPRSAAARSSQTPLNDVSR